MPRGVERPRDPLRDSLHLLGLYNRGLVPAIVTSGARQEQDLSRLSGEDLDTLLSLLNLPSDKGAQTDAVRTVGLEKALALLVEAIRQPLVPAPGYPYIIHAYQQQHIDGVAWLLEEVRVWLTGVTISFSLWTSWPPDTLMPDPGPPPALRWNGVERIDDDRGTTYFISDWFSGGPHQPALVSSSGQTTMPRAIQKKQTVWPGPPPEARRLILHAAPKVLVAEPRTSPPPWPEREVWLPETTYVFHLEHRMEILLLNKKTEPRLDDGVRLRL